MAIDTPATHTLKVPAKMVRYEKLKNGRGRLTGEIKATFIDTNDNDLFSVTGESVAQVNELLLTTLQRIGEALRHEPVILVWRTKSILIYPTVTGEWGYGWIDWIKGYTTGNVGGFTYLEALRRARVQLAEVEWDGKEETSDLILHRDDQKKFTEWAIFQKRYRELEALGFDHYEIHWLLDGSARYMMSAERFASLPPLPDYIKL